MKVILLSLAVALVAVLPGLKFRGRSPSAEQKLRHTYHISSSLFYAISFQLQDTDWLPDSSIGMTFLLDNPGVPGWNGPYYEAAEVVIDSWGTPFRLQIDGDTLVLMSAGPDRSWQTDDDIRVLKQR